MFMIRQPGSVARPLSRHGVAARGQQRGIGLMETMIAMAVGLVVTAAMITLMANTMGSGTRTIEMSRLQQEMRAAMQLITRDVRRSAYNAEAILCFGNLDCGSDGTFAHGLAGDVVLSSDNDCVIFEMDRDHNGDPTDDPPGGFRLETNNDGVGIIQMWTGSGDPSCGSDNSGWVSVTDPEFVDVTEFLACLEIDAGDPECNGLLDDGSADPNMPSSLSYENLVDDDGSGSPVYQRVRRLQLRISAHLVGDTSIGKTLIDRIHVRNSIVL
jgi:type IV pilus assembly protein PilW